MNKRTIDAWIIIQLIKYAAQNSFLLNLTQFYIVAAYEEMSEYATYIFAVTSFQSNNHYKNKGFIFRAFFFTRKLPLKT